MHQMSIIVLLIALTLISGLADAQGFVHASNVWLNGKLVWLEVIKSTLGFGIGLWRIGFASGFCKILALSHRKFKRSHGLLQRSLVWPFSAGSFCIGNSSIKLLVSLFCSVSLGFWLGQ